MPWNAETGNISEAEIARSIKQMAIDEFLQFITGQFEQAFCDEMGCPCLEKVYDSHIIAEDAGKLYRVNYMIANERALFIPKEDWTPVEVIYQDKAATLLGEYKQFSDDPWDGAASQWDTAEAYCMDCLIDVNPSGEAKTKQLCYLPYRSPGSSEVNKGALRAIVGGRGITRLEKPSNVDESTWTNALKRAANRVISWYPEAFDMPAPQSIYDIADKTRPEEKAKTLWDRAKEAVKWLFEEPVKHPQETPVNFDEPFGIAVKTVNGQPWHFTWSTNAFLDRDGEIFSTKSLENYVAQNEQKEDKGTFDFWHIPNTDFATKEWQAVVGRFLLEAGPYMDNETGQRAKAFFQKYPNSHPTIAPEGWGASPEFEYDPMDRMDGVYDWIDIVKTSTLPRGKAANLYTKGSQVIMNDEQRKAAIAVFGEEFVNQNEKAALEATNKLEESLAFKAKEKADPQEDTQKETPKEAKPQEQTQVNFDEKALEELGKVISKQLALEVDIAPLQEQVEALTKEMDGLKEELNQLKEQKETKEEAETPRYIFSLMQRASEAKGSEIDDNDELRQRKPKQAETKFGVSGAIFGNQ